jgi:hypothetical protein
VLLREPKEAAVAAGRGRERGLGEDDPAVRGGDDGERVGVAMGVDAEHEIHFVCKHLC